MYSIYKTIHSPTGIEHCLYCNLISSTAKSLVVSSSNRILVYELITEVSANVSKLEGGFGTTTDGETKHTYLECVFETTLCGYVTSMRCVTLPGYKRDALLLAFNDAKLSLIEYDPLSRNLKTTSMHYFEEDDLRGRLAHNIHLPEIRVDPEGRCAVMLIFGCQLAILPFQTNAGLLKSSTRLKDDNDSYQTGGGSKMPQILSSYVINLDKLDIRIKNIKDLQFLHGYYEPTLFILHEPLPTCAGRLAARSDTCSIAALSLNMHQKVHPIIWSLDNLPFDCRHVVPVPRPVSGVLVLAVNSLIYLNQSVPPFAVAINSIAETTTNFPMTHQSGVVATLDCANAVFLNSNQLLLSVNTGELYVINLLTESMKLVRGFHFECYASTVLTTCMCILEDEYVFLGSRLGNSALLSFKERIGGETLQNLDQNLAGENSGRATASQLETILDEPVSKKMKTKMTPAQEFELLAAPVELDQLKPTDVHDEETVGDEFEIFAANQLADDQLTGSNRIKMYQFELCDRLVNVGPCGHCALGFPAFLSDEFVNNVDPDVELVTTSGHGKNGALMVLQRSIRPQVVTTFQLPGCRDMWTLKSPLTALATQQKVPVEEPETDDSATVGDSEGKATGSSDTVGSDKPVDTRKSDTEHAFLLLSRDDSTMILQTGQEISEVEQSGFSTQARTVAAGNVDGNRLIVQVTTGTVTLLSGLTELQKIPTLEQVVRAVVEDPYVFVLTEKGRGMLYVLSTELGIETAQLVRVDFCAVEAATDVTAASLYKDHSGLFSATLPPDWDSVEECFIDFSIATAAEDTASAIPKWRAFRSEVDDEDEMLYGSDATIDQSIIAASANTSKKRHVRNVVQMNSTFWLVLARKENLEIYRLPDATLMFSVHNFVLTPQLLVDSSKTEVSKRQLHETEIPIAHEVLLVGLGNNGSRPILAAIVGEDIVVYEAFVCDGLPGHLQIRFRKLPHSILLYERSAKRNEKRAADDANSDLSNPTIFVPRLRYFADIAGYTGIFVTGPHPFWLLLSAKGLLRTHSMQLDGHVTCFASFHNVNCKHGFLYFNAHSEMRICLLPNYMNYDAEWAMRKVALGCRAHFVCYEPDVRIYVVASSVQSGSRKLARLEGEGEKVFDEHQKDADFVYPLCDEFSLQLISPLTWQPIPGTKISMDVQEYVLSMQTVSLATDEHVSGSKCYIAVGTNYCHGEDMISKGRIHVYDVVDVVPEPGQPLTKNKLKTVVCKEDKGPVSAVTSCKGFLLTAVGQRVYMSALKSDDLLTCAFLDTGIYIHQMVSIKSFFLALDVQKSVSVYRVQDQLRVFSLVSRDLRPLETYAGQFLIDGDKMEFVVTDRERNLIVYEYNPDLRESAGGQKLVRRQDFNVGRHITCMARLRCAAREFVGDERMLNLIQRRHVLLLPDLDGGISFLLPLREVRYRRLLMLQTVLTTHLTHLAGLNPREYRHIRQSFPSLQNPCKNVLDGDLVWKFLHLSWLDRQELVERIGTTLEQIMDDLAEIYHCTAVL